MKTEKTRVQKLIPPHADAVYKDFQTGRFGEEREWRESGLFYQRKQWLDYEEDKRRFTQIKPSKSKPVPMPVSNYFAKTVNANANALGGDLVRMTVIAKDDDPMSRRAAEYAEMAKDAIDDETQMRIHNPLLAKHTALWGLGVMKDVIDVSTAEGSVDAPEMEEDVKMMLGCYDCGTTRDVSAEEALNSATDTSQIQVPCPDCGSNTTMVYPSIEPSVKEVHKFGKGKIKSRVCPIFEVFLPRDCQNANLAKKIIHRYRLSTNEAKHLYPAFADQIKGDEHKDHAEVGYDDLKMLVPSRSRENAEEQCTITELWSQWEELPEKTREAIEEENAEDPEALEEMQKYGIFAICIGNDILAEFGANPYVDLDTDEPFFPFTFFYWEVDPASVYPKGIGEDLKPLQKRLNRIDSLIELAMMTNAVGKWLWPTTQSHMKPPTGTANEVAEYDPIGDAKFKPEFVQPSPFHPSVWQLRNAILQDFEQLGLLPAVSQGDMPNGTAFRTVAYLGAKAAEQITTQRFLWETAHALRYKKLLCIAKKFWDEERKVRVAGHNGKLLYQSLMGEDLRGNYDADYVRDSSRPKTLEEKLQAIELLFSAGLINPADPATRQYIMDMLNLEGLNLADELQYRKAARDLEKLKRGEMPTPSPYQKWDVFLKSVADFTLTEDFEELDEITQTFILAYGEYLNQMVSQVQMEMQQQQQAQMVGEALAGAMGKGKGVAASGGAGKGKKDDLSGVPGADIAPQRSESAAVSQGDKFASQFQ